MVLHSLVLVLILNIGPSILLLDPGHLKDNHSVSVSAKGRCKAIVLRDAPQGRNMTFLEGCQGPHEVLRLFRWLCYREMYINLKYGKYL